VCCSRLLQHCQMQGSQWCPAQSMESQHSTITHVSTGTSGLVIQQQGSLARYTQR
jgi:hypothetical protein